MRASPVVAAAFAAVAFVGGLELINKPYSYDLFMARLWAQEALPLLGIWTFNAAKSTADPDLVPFRRGTCRIEPSDEGLKVTYDLVRLRGGITHLEWTGRIDGKDYALQGVEADVTNAYRRIDDHTYEIVQKVNGVATVTERLTVSPDGRTITTVAPTVDAGGRRLTITTVYEKKE